MSLIKTLIEDPLEFEPKDIQEPYTQYVRHFIYMVKRNERTGNQPIGYGSDSESTMAGIKKATKPKTTKIIPTAAKSELRDAAKKPAKKKKTVSEKKKS